MVLARAISRRVFFSWVWSPSCWVAFCMRRLKCAFSSSAISFSRPAASLARSSEAFMVILATPSSSADLARDERRLQRQLGRGELERLARQRLGHAVDLVQDLARRDLGHVILGVALAVAHADFGRLLRALLA